MKNKGTCYQLLVLLFFIAFATEAQNTAVDSLKKVLRNTKVDTTKINSYNALANEYKETSPDSASFFAHKATLIATQNNDNFGLANAAMTLGNVNIIKSNYKQALIHFNAAIDFYKKAVETNSPTNLKEIKNGLARAYASIGVVYSEVNNYSIALDYYLKALPIYQEINQKNSVSKVYNNIGIIYKSQKNYTKAKEYFLKALKIQTEIKETTLPVTLMNIGAVNFEQGKYDAAWNYYSKSKTQFEKTEKTRNYGLLLNYIAEYYSKKRKSYKSTSIL